MATQALAFVFPGQGAQYVGMGKDFAEAFPEVREVFAQADEALDFSIRELCFHGPEDELTKTENTQPAILTVSCALLELVRRHTSLVPRFVAGHSLGEYSALVAAEVLSFPDAVRIVRRRGELMEAAVPAGTGGMAAVIGLTHEEVAALCAEVSENYGPVEPATLNAPGQTVIAGSAEALQVAVDKVKAAGARRAVRLAVSGPFHSSMLRRAGEQLAAELEKATWHEPKVPVVANVSARPVTDVEAIQRALVDQVSSAVRWEESVRYMVQQGVRLFLEIGPGKVLSGLIRRIDPSVEILDLADLESWDKLLARLKGDGII